MSRKVGIAALIWGGSILLSRVIGLVREGVFGRIVGGGSDADAYWTAFVIPNFLNYLLAAGALSLVFIPIFAEHLERDDAPGAWHAFSVIFNAVAALLAVALPVLWLAVPALVDVVTPGFEGATAAEFVLLTRIVLPAQIFHVLGGLLSAVLQARDRHALPALAPLVYSAAIIVGGLVGGSAEGFAWGVLIGALLGPFGLPLIGCLRMGFGWRPVFDVRDPDLRAWLVRSLPIMFGFSIVVVDDWILSNQGSLLRAGTISTLQYAKTLMKVPMGVFGLAAGVAAYPTLSRLVARGERAAAFRTLSGAVRRMLVLAFAAQVALTAAGPEVARVVYGSRLLPGQHAAIGAALAVFCAGLWAWAAQTVISRGFYAQGRTWLPTVVGSLVVLAALPVYWVLRERLGMLGLATASSLAISAYVVVLIVLLRRDFAGESDGYGAFAARTIPAVLAGLAAGLLLRQVLPAWPALVRGAVLGSAAVAVYAAGVIAMRVAEVKEVVDIVARGLGR